MGPRLLGLAAILARRQGTAAAQALLRKANAWMADPLNDAARQALVEQLRVGAERAGGTAARLGARLAKEVEKRRVSVGAWERDVMSLRYEVADMAPGPVRDAAIDAYVAQVSAAIHLVNGSNRPGQARTEVMRALAAEERMLRGERLGAVDRGRALDAVNAARAACAAR
jgi:hypothetical protein